ncbi:MAG TPA: 50S ribosomal protein L17 [Bacteriovoracaceae bacterium]|nr:50S ribosomal protein L17 [Bacteriovoracaceae bacterium]
MRHGNHKYKLGVNPQHRKSLMRNLSIELITHGKIKTTETKAKAIKPFIEKLVTLAKNDTVANRRLAFTKLNNKDAVNNLFVNVAPKFKQRPGGYTRLLKISDRRLGDGAKEAIIAFVE